MARKRRVPAWAFRAAVWALEALLRTMRVRVVGSEHVEPMDQAKDPYVAVFWHSRLLPVAFAYRGSDVATLISRSRDGEMIAGVAARWGYRVERGSSSRGGGEGLRAVVRHLQARRRVALTPDGPRGPARVMKAGPLQAARLTGAPVVPVAVAADRAWRAGSWDRFMVPKPFARVLIRFGEPVFVAPDAPPDELERLRVRLEEGLNDLVDRADDDVRR
ncbi:MAG TPA: lysophospholipid acyltransferase family protein [Longimicrobiales bacterium]|nr:lysophospholipid acyltransferase family protein [Longimicrobiales bacterium]